MSKFASGTKVRRRLPRAIKVLAWLFGILICLPIAVFALWNSFDEAPNANATRYLKVPVQRIPDAENAWLVFAGLDAAENLDPITIGRRRVDSFSARAAQQPMPKADAGELELFKDALPVVDLDAAVDGVAELCVPSEGNCLHWALQHGDALKRLQRANAVRLARTQRLMQLPGWQNLYPATFATPYSASGVFYLQRLLTAQRLAQSESNPAAATEALAQLGKTAVFWRQVRASPQDLISIEISGRQLEAVAWLVSEWLDRAPRVALAANAQALDQILAVPANKLDWFNAIGDQFRGFEHTMRGEMPGVASGWWHCVSSNSDEYAAARNDSCLIQAAMNLAYVHQATMNLAADNYAQFQLLAEASPQQLPAVEAAGSIILERAFPQFDNHRVLMQQMRYNFAGRILAAIAIPAFDYGKREQDRDALRRMVQIKREAGAAGISAALMQRFMLARAHLCSPPDGLPILWDQKRAELSFVPLAKKYWKRELIVVGFPQLRRG